MKSMAFDIRNLPFAGTVTRWHSVNCHRYHQLLSIRAWSLCTRGKLHHECIQVFI